MNKLFSLAAGIAASLVVAGCSGPYAGLLATHGWTVDGDFAQARAARAEAGSFNEHLRTKYLALAETDRADYDWMDAAYYARNATRAGNGQRVLPIILTGDAFMEPKAELPALVAARADLISVLDGGARARTPELAATAQTQFDCWAEEQEENWEFDEIAACRAGYMDAMNAMTAMRQPPMKSEVVEPPSSDYLVFFDFDQSLIREDAAVILQKVLQAHKALETKETLLVGHTDRAGADLYNQTLSERRARTVKNWLAIRGIPADTISTVGHGEGDPRVTTPDGMREQENRRVEIRLK